MASIRPVLCRSFHVLTRTLTSKSARKRGIEKCYDERCEVHFITHIPPRRKTKTTMTASEIFSIAVTVGICQICLDLAANYLVYKKEPYQRACSALERARWKLNKAEAELAKNPKKNEKRHQRAKDDFGEAAARVAQKHTAPSMLTSLFFLILLRILGAENKGNVIAVLPFTPFKLLARITRRGLDWGSMPSGMIEGSNVFFEQGASYLFIYFLATMSVKVYCSKIFGTTPPSGADRGIMTVMDSPQGQKMAKAMGVDPDDLKFD